MTDMLDVEAVDKWELLKSKVKDFSIKHYQNNIKAKICSIEKEINDIEESNSQTFDMNRKRQLRLQLNTLCDDKCKGAQVRSRVKMDFDLEKKHQLNTAVNELYTDQKRNSL